ncbi:MAG: hypothetical protein DRN04_07795 [Thermoprotei archaeon]|nr:MAG: hypothetical protein DRN04_07795 [Thermoprotei archaeon]
MNRLYLKRNLILSTLLVALLLSGIAVAGPLEEKLKELKKIYNDKLAEYAKLEKAYNELSAEVQSLFNELFTLRLSIIALGIVVFVIGFIIGYKHEMKITYSKEK